MGATGTATIDFGAAPGTNVTSVVVTGQTGILSGSFAEAFMMADSTVSGATGHNAEEHKLVPIKLTCGSVVAGTGFTIFAESSWRLTSTFQVRWVWN
jgi:hypothetical protein